MRTASLLLCLAIFSGCVDAGTSGQLKKPDKRVVESGISQMAYEACQKRDLQAGKRLQVLGAEIKSGKRKYDGPILDEVKRINTEETDAAFSEVEQKLIDSFDPQKAKLDPQKCGNAVIEYGKGRSRAGEK